MAPEITINKLKTTEKELIFKIAHWYFEEWNTPLDKTIRRLESQYPNDIIFQLVLRRGDKVMATGGLYNNVNLFHVHEKFKTLKPWVALLYTDKAYRNQGMGRILLEQIERRAKKNKLLKIYLYTFTAESLYKRCGWKVIERISYKGHDTAVMEKEV